MRSRVLLIICMPLIFSGLLSTGLIVSVVSSQLKGQSEQFGQAISDQLAISVSDHLVNNDVLSLNVLLTELTAKSHFDSASVYNTNNELLAQAGNPGESSQLFTQQVTFRNVISGYIQVGFDPRPRESQITQMLFYSISVHLFLVIIIVLIGWFYGDLFYVWTAQTRQLVANNPSVNEDKAPVTSESETTSPHFTILVIKVRPTRLLPGLLPRLNQALALYAGSLEDTDGDDILVLFKQEEQLVQAACSGLLILEMFKQKESGVTIKVGMHQVSDSTDVASFEQAKKHASYLASISENQMLTSRLIQEIIAPLDQFESHSFHSSMTPDGEVYYISALSNQSLIESQAREFMSHQN